MSLKKNLINLRDENFLTDKTETRIVILTTN